MTREQFGKIMDLFFEAGKFPLMTGRGQVVEEFIIHLRAYCECHRIALDYIVEKTRSLTDENRSRDQDDGLCFDCGDAGECPTCAGATENQ